MKLATIVRCNFCGKVCNEKDVYMLSLAPVELQFGPQIGFEKLHICPVCVRNKNLHPMSDRALHELGDYD